MPHINFTTNTEVADQICPTRMLKLIAYGSWGGGTLELWDYDADFDGYLLVESWTANFADRVMLGANTKYKIVFTGGTGHDVDVSHNGIYGD